MAYPYRSRSRRSGGPVAFLAVSLVVLVVAALVIGGYLAYRVYAGDPLVPGGAADPEPRAFRSVALSPDPAVLLACQGGVDLSPECRDFVNLPGDSVVTLLPSMSVREAGLGLPQPGSLSRRPYLVLDPPAGRGSLHPLYCVYEGPPLREVAGSDAASTAFVTVTLFWAGGPLFETVDLSGAPSCRVHLFDGSPPHAGS